MSLNKLQIRDKIIITCVLVSVFFFSGIHFYWLPYYLENKKSEYIDQQYSYTKIVDAALGDLESSKGLAKRFNFIGGILKENSVWQEISLYDEANHLIYTSGNLNLENIKINNNKYVELNYDIVRSGNLISRMKVVTDIKENLETEKGGILNFEIISLCVLSVTAILIIFLQERWIRTPLLKLSYAVKQMSLGDMSVILPNSTNDEIGEMAFAVRTLSNSLQLTKMAFHDEVAEAKAMAAELKKSEQRFRTVFKSIVDTLILIDQSGKIKSVNPAATKMLGYEEQELVGQSIELIIPDTHKDRHRSYISAYLSGNGVGFVGGVPRENYVVCKDRKQIPVNISINSLKIGDKDHFIGVIRDNSAYKHIQHKLTAEKELAQNYLNTASVIMMAIDNKGYITLVNKKSCEVLGYTEQQLLNKDWFKTLFENDVARELSEEFSKAMLGETFFPDYLECHIRTSNNEEKIVVWHSNLVRDTKTGELSGLLVSGEDITETRKSEKTRKYLQKQLQQAQKMEAVGQLTGGIAHDFNNILASIMGYSELAILKAEKTKDEKLKQYLGNIYHSGERARDLVGKMLAFSRGKDSETPSPLYLNTVLNELTPMLRSVIPTSVQIKSQLEENLRTILADTIDIQQIAMNLCINARDAMEGKGLITIHTRNVSHCGTVCASCHKNIVGDYIEMTVEDTGPGITNDKINRLFEPFFSTKEIGKGTGLGLSVIHGVVHARGGHILVESADGKGSKFRILFKPEKQDNKDNLEAEGLVEVNEKATLNGKKNILIADTEATVVNLVAEILKVNGYEVQHVVDIKNAFDRIKEKPDQFNLLIVGPSLLIGSGTKYIKKIHSINENFPIILFSNRAREHADITLAQSELVTVCSKPTNSQTLLDLVSSTLSKCQEKIIRVASA